MIYDIYLHLFLFLLKIFQKFNTTFLASQTESIGFRKQKNHKGFAGLIWFFE